MLAGLVGLTLLAYLVGSTVLICLFELTFVDRSCWLNFAPFVVGLWFSFSFSFSLQLKLIVLALSSL